MKRKIFALILMIAVLAQTTVFAAEHQTYPKIVKFDVSDGTNTVVVTKSDGTMDAKSTYFVDRQPGISMEHRKALLELTDVADVASSHNTVVVLKTDGTLYIASSKTIRLDTMLPSAYKNVDMKFEEAQQWTNIVDIDCGNGHLVGLKSDGTVVACGANDYMQCDVSEWTDVEYIEANWNYTMGIRKDGTVLITEPHYQQFTSTLTNVKKCIPEMGIWLTRDGEIKMTHEYYVKQGGKKYPDGSPDPLSYDVVPFSGWNEIVVRDGFGPEIVDIATAYHEFYSEGGFMPKHSYSFFALDGNGNLLRLELNPQEDFSTGQVFVYAAAAFVRTNVVAMDAWNGSYYVLTNRGTLITENESAQKARWISHQKPGIGIYFNDNRLNPDVPPYIKDGRTLAPLRAILETLGLNVSWDPDTRTATAINASVTITVTIDSNIAIVNGEQKKLDVPAEITDGRTFVPVRFFAEAIDHNVDWDAETQSVIITE